VPFFVLQLMICSIEAARSSMDSGIGNQVSLEFDNKIIFNLEFGKAVGPELCIVLGLGHKTGLFQSSAGI
jgi:hypothetical protein